jgi:hypothetical protein
MPVSKEQAITCLRKALLLSFLSGCWQILIEALAQHRLAPAKGVRYAADVGMT